MTEKNKDKATAVLLPSMGEGITEAHIVKWLKQPGDKVAADEPLLEVSTDKVDTEVPAPVGGYLVKTWVEADETAAVNACIAHIADSPDVTVEKPSAPEAPAASAALSSPGSGTATAAPAAGSPTLQGQGQAPAPAIAPIGAQILHPDGAKSSPLVRRLAASYQIDLRYVPGTGAFGRITKADFDDYLIRTRMPIGAPAKDDAHLEWGRVETVRDPDDPETEKLDGVVVRREKMSKMRVLTAEHMSRSVRTSPHVTMSFEMDLNEIVKVREASKGAFERANGFKLTYTPFFIYAAIQAIKEHPIVNVSVDGEDILWKDDINFGCAVALPSGLIVPVIHKAQDKDFKGVATSLNDLVERARTKKLKPEDVQGGTFSVTNPGMFGCHVATPIINQPQVAILCVNSIAKKPVVQNDEIVIHPIIQIGLTFDHRVIDGEGGAKYLATLKTVLESASGMGTEDIL